MISRSNVLYLAAVAFSALLVAGCESVAEPSAPGVKPLAVSSPYLEAAVVDLLGGDTPLVRLAGPSSCPGHFDVRPSQIRELADCRLLIRFDFQAGLDRLLAERRNGEPRIVTVSEPGGLCVPDTYLAVCRRLADRFAADGTMSRSAANAKLAEIERREAALGKAASDRIDAAGLRGAPVLCSKHQADFCRWLGLRVAAEFPNADTASTGGIDRAVTDAAEARVRFIIANEPEGRRAADALADRLHAAVIVFANFPEPGKPDAFDAMVRRNLSALAASIDGKSMDK